MNELEMRQLYAELQPGDRVEVIHHIKIGFRHWMAKNARELGIMVRQVEDEIAVANMAIGGVSDWKSACEKALL